MDEAALFELAGHPHVVDEAGAAMEVVRGEPELVVDEREGGLRARLVPDDGDSEDYHVRLVGGRRCEVIRFTPDHKRLRAVLPEGGLELPAAACPALASSGAEPPWVLPDPADALELLEQLHAADVPCLRPKGEPLKIVARAATSKLNLTVKSAAEWFSATGTLEVDEGRTLDLKQLFALLDASPGSRFLELAEGEFIALTALFRRHFAGPVERDGDPAARARLRRLVAPFVLRRLKTEVLDDLPPRTEVVLHVDLSPAEAALYEALRRRAPSSRPLPRPWTSCSQAATRSWCSRSS